MSTSITPIISTKLPSLASCSYRADQGLATPTDLAIFQRFLTDQYCPTVVEIQPDYYPSVEFYQEYDEPLAAYHSRVLTTLHRAGGRDEPLSTTDSLSPLESHTLRDFVNRFVRGLYDKASCKKRLAKTSWFLIASELPSKLSNRPAPPECQDRPCPQPSARAEARLGIQEPVRQRSVPLRLGGAPASSAVWLAIIYKKSAGGAGAEGWVSRKDWILLGDGAGP
ncbi:hypothetical protein E4U61_003737 [Claviceps capensis]|nr:hypothetical protein E4U61_003737 [Claviceps capensis]